MTNQGNATIIAQNNLLAIYQALDKAQAIIEFKLDGTVISANENFLRIFGYTLDEIVGKHHRMFCEPSYAASEEYLQFWQKLGCGEYHEGEAKRLGKDGSKIWLQASYNPIFNEAGNPMKVMKVAADVTVSKRQNAEFKGKIRAIERSQAVIEFELDGTVITANENFLHIFGYTLDEIVGKHHRMFCEPSYVASKEYVQLWQKLKRGEYETGECQRLNKKNEEIWLQASYNPIFDADGHPFKVVKFASDITEEVKKRRLAMMEMSTPVTAISQDLLLMPIVGIVDRKRAMDIMDKALQSIATTNARALILDISGVDVVDTDVANHLIKIAGAIVLMGRDTIISGISPAIAQTIVQLGIDLKKIKTTARLQDAILEASKSKRRV